MLVFGMAMAFIRSGRLDRMSCEYRKIAISVVALTT
jgi:hypothetical protein